MLNLFDLEPLDRRENGVGIEADAAAAKPDDRDCLGFHEALHETLAHAEPFRDADQIGQLFALVELYVPLRSWPWNPPKL